MPRGCVCHLKIESVLTTDDTFQSSLDLSATVPLRDGTLLKKVPYTIQKLSFFGLFSDFLFFRVQKFNKIKVTHNTDLTSLMFFIFIFIFLYI